MMFGKPVQCLTNFLGLHGLQALLIASFAITRLPLLRGAARASIGAGRASSGSAAMRARSLPVNQPLTLASRKLRQ